MKCVCVWSLKGERGEWMRGLGTGRGEWMRGLGTGRSVGRVFGLRWCGWCMYGLGLGSGGWCGVMYV